MESLKMHSVAERVRYLIADDFVVSEHRDRCDPRIRIQIVLRDDYYLTRRRCRGRLQ